MPGRRRLWLVAATAVLLLCGTLHGLGLLGTPGERAANSGFSAETALLAEAALAFAFTVGGFGHRPASQHALR